MKHGHRHAFLPILWLLAACSLDLSEKRACHVPSDCNPGWQCVDTRCTRGGSEALEPDHDAGDATALMPDAAARMSADAAMSGPDAATPGPHAEVDAAAPDSHEPAEDAGSGDGATTSLDAAGPDTSGRDAALDGSDGADAALQDAGFAEPFWKGGLTLWLTADRGLTSSVAGVNRWADQSTRGFDALQELDSSQPQLVADGGPTGGPALVFDGIDDHLTLGTNYIFSSFDGMVFFLVIRSDADRSTQPYSDPMIFNFGKGASNDLALQYDYASIGFRATTAGIPLTSHGVGQGNWAILTYQIVFGSTLRARVNGEELGLAPATALERLTAVEIDESTTRDFEAGPVTIGAQSKTQLDTLRYLSGALAEIRVFDVALNDVKRDQIECELAERYGIPIRHACP